jgi:hypothetical protein
MDTEIKEIVDFILREAERLKRVCDLYDFGAISSSLEMTVTEAKRLLSDESDSELTKQ